MAGSLPAQQQVSQSEPESTSDTQVSPKQLYHNDLWLVILKDTLRWNDYVYVAGVALITAAVVFGLGFLLGVPFDLGYIIRGVLQTLIFPILALIYLTVPAHIAKLFNTLNDNHVIGPYKVADPKTDPQRARKGVDTYEHFLSELERKVDNLWWTLGALVLVIVYCVYRLVFIWLHPTSYTSIWLEIAILLNNSFMIYSITLCAARLILTLVYTNYLFQAFKIHLSPLHPDGSAGLGVMGDILGISAGMLATMGMASIVLNSAFFAKNVSPTSFNLPPSALWEAAVVGVIYLILAPTLLLGWLYLPHKVMQQGRDEALQPLADEFESTIDKAAPKETDSAEDIKQGTNRLDELRRRYKLLQDPDTYPVWPAPIQRIRRFAFTISIPPLITFIGTLPEIYNKLVPFLMKLFHG